MKTLPQRIDYEKCTTKNTLRKCTTKSLNGSEGSHNCMVRMREVQHRLYTEEVSVKNCVLKNLDCQSQSIIEFNHEKPYVWTTLNGTFTTTDERVSRCRPLNEVFSQKRT